MMTTSFPVTCPQCGYRIMKTLGEYEAQEDFRCPGCNLLIKVNDIRGIQESHQRTPEKHAAHVPQEVIRGLVFARSRRTRRNLVSSLR